MVLLNLTLYFLNNVKKLEKFYQHFSPRYILENNRRKSREKKHEIITPVKR